VFICSLAKKKESIEMRTNVKPVKQKVLNHEGALVPLQSDEIELRRAVMSTLLGEDTYYEDGQSIKDRIAALVTKVPAPKVSRIAVQARNEMHLRHAPLFIAREMARHKTHRPFVSETLRNIVNRADEPAEFLAMYYKDGKQPLANSVKSGLRSAFKKFNRYQLAKYNRSGTVSLRDVMFLVHPKPDNEEQAETWKMLAEDRLPTPDTWEVELSRNDGVSKKDKWTRFLKERKLGALALLRNLRNMTEAGVDTSLIVDALNDADVSQVLPFRFIAANRASNGIFARHLDTLLLKNLRESKIRLRGRTVVLIDVSGSMDAGLSGKSDLTRMDAAAALGVVVSELSDACDVYTFSNRVVRVNDARGLSGINNIINSQSHGGTELAKAVREIQSIGNYDRLVIVTDEQAQDADEFKQRGDNKKNYVINVAPYRSGVGVSYTEGVSNGAVPNWVAINGFSEAVVSYISAMESLSNEQVSGGGK
jgi:60 kDa SS-A/Ro ribonucleoprotein